MTVRATTTATASAGEAAHSGVIQRVDRFLDREGVLGYLLMTPALLPG